MRSALVAVCLLFASGARAESDGVPFLEGQWTGKIKGIYYDQTNEGSNDPKQKWKDRVEVDIFQDSGEGDFDMNISFENGIPTTGSTVVTEAELDGFVGNYHLSLMNEAEATPILLGSGKVNNRGSRIKMRVFAATEDYTVEFELHLKKQGD